MTVPPSRPPCRVPGAPAAVESGGEYGGRGSGPGRRFAGRLRGRAGRPAGPVADRLRISCGDAVLGTVAMLVTLGLSAVAARPGDRDLWPGGAALIVVASLVLAVRRRHPAIVLAVATIAPQVYYPLGYPDGPVLLLSLIALFNAAVECRLIVSLGAVIAANAGFIVASLLWADDAADPDAPLDAGALAGLSLGLLVTVAAGQHVRGRRDRAEAAEARAAAAERDREQEARRRETQERLRIARELHDVLAHRISLINVQAGAALHRRDDPERAYGALEAIKGASKETLREMRTVLGVLRQVDQDDGGGLEGGGLDGGGAGGSPVAPVPSLARIGELLERTAAAGLTVRRAGDLAARGEAAAGLAGLPAPVGLAGYRIVQEALTNVVRHSGAGRVTVEVRCTPAAVVIEVVDDGEAGAGESGGGNGLRGMRERAAAVGGEMTAGPGPAGGYRVRAWLPLDRAAGPPERP